jgi:hypothetical protein
MMVLTDVIVAFEAGGLRRGENEGRITIIAWNYAIWGIVPATGVDARAAAGKG